MFAVPGWSVSADSLKAETALVKAEGGNKNDATKSRKRKRASGPAVTNVTESNVADLWERVVEGKAGKKAKVDDSQSAKEHKKRKHSKHHPEQNALDGEKPTGILSAEAGLEAVASPAEAVSGPGPKEGKNERKKKHRKEQEDQQAVERMGREDAKKSASKPTPATPKLTPLQASMREKLVSARFRHLNETLYTKPSEEAFKLFDESPEMFQEYHDGFRRQVNVWPENPVDGYIGDIKLRGQQRGPPREKRNPHDDAPIPESGIVPLPRTSGTCRIADLGCGDAKLSETLQSQKKKLKLDILSYDLQSSKPWVTKADIANLPLEAGSVNVVIFCLALMGTNWLDFIDEAYRILHWKAELWVAEIKSRFAPVKGKHGVVAHSVGNRRKQGKKAKDADGAEDESKNEADLAIEVDGTEDKRHETDVSAFVDALRRRGFVLQGEADLSNKMFVKMHFIKAAPATVGKNATAVREPSRQNFKKHAVKYLEANDETRIDESTILKPCVYKLR